jgi:hypothetical protein
VVAQLSSEVQNCAPIMYLRVYCRWLGEVTKDTLALVVVALLYCDPEVIDAFFLNWFL